MAANRGRPVFW